MFAKSGLMTAPCGVPLPSRSRVHLRVRLPSTEATRRLAAACPGDPALVVGLTGPAFLAAQIARAMGVDPATALATDAALMETAGRAVLEVARQFLLAGANVIILLEGNLPTSDTVASDTWSDVVTPIANLTRFHKAVPIMVGPVDVGRCPYSADLSMPRVGDDPLALAALAGAAAAA